MTGSAPRPSDVPGTEQADPDAWRRLRPGKDLEGLRALDGIRARLFGRAATTWRVGRYELRQRLGAGGLGVVYAAYDPELDREVAIKLLRDLVGHDRGREQSRLLREGQAIARLSHPNVVQVFDVGTYDRLHELDEGDGGLHSAGVFIVMERLEGQTLAQWLESEPRPWREVLDRFIAAGRGIAAAHEGGVVHRDFKPANVFVERSGRVRVLDFGLARGREAEPATTTVYSVRGDSDHSRRSITSAGTVLGTPAYMAPEQHEGRVADARSDQYSFCASLYGGLYRVLPFASHELDALADDKRRVALSRPLADVRVPRWLRAVLRRGLSPDPEQRWPTMGALLRELSPRRRTRRRRRAWASGVGGLAAGSLLWASWGEPAAPCASGHRWDASSREAVQQALGAVEVGRQALPRVTDTLDAYATAWDAEHQRVCEATPDPDLDLRSRCLRRAATHLDTLIDVLAHADAKVATEAASAVASLPPIERCRDLEVLRDELALPSDPADHEAAEALREGIAEVSALVTAGKIDDALVRAQARVADAERLGHPPLLAEAQWWQGHVLGLAGDSAGAMPVLERAAMTATAHGHDKVAALAAVELANMLGRLARYDEGLEWARHAEAAALRYGRGRYPEARAYVAKGTLMRLLGRNEEAHALYQRALVVQQTADPSSHELPTILNNLGTAALGLGRNDEAHRHYESSYERLAAILGDAHPQTAAARMNLGIITAELGRYEQALAHYSAARESLVLLFGPHDPRVAYCDVNLGNLWLDRGDPRRAEARFTAALDVFGETLGPEHPNTAIARAGLGLAQLGRGRPAEAEPALETALAHLQQSFGAEHPQVGVVMTMLGRARLAQGDVEGARARLEAALAVLERVEAPPNAVHEARFHLARVRWEAGEHEAAWSQAREVQRGLDGRSPAAIRAEVDAWLAAHPREPASP